MRKRWWLLLLLVLLLSGLQYRLWHGEGNWSLVEQLKKRIEDQQNENRQLQQHNEALAAEVQDLKEGAEAIEERARSELGMIMPGEKFYRVIQDSPPAYIPLPQALPSDYESDH